MKIPPAPPQPWQKAKLIPIGLALVTAMVLWPAMWRHEKERVVPPEKLSWRMPELVGKTQDALISEFGAPLSTKDYSLQEGSFAGPDVGLKHYYLTRNADSAARLKDAQTTWTFPKYTAIREVIWKLPDSYLTVWLQEPRAEGTFDNGNMELTLPTTKAGEWVALDDYRVGKDLLARASSTDSGRLSRTPK